MSRLEAVDPPVGADAPSTNAQEAPRGRSGWLIVILSGAACIGVSLVSGTHLGLVLILVPVVVAVTWQSPRTMIAVLPVWMAMLGLVRRLTPGGGNVTFSGDPVLIIGPLIIFMLFVMAVSRGATKDRTRLATIVGALSIIALVEALNPHQATLLTGLGGLLFILVPMLAFWIGRSLVDEDLAHQLVRTVAILSLLAAIYGLLQQFNGLPSWDSHWVSTKGYSALAVGSVVRAFGTFSSAQEYAAFLSVGLVAWLALSGKGNRFFGVLHFAGLGTVAVALWFESERTAVFLSVLAIGVMVAARLRLPSIGVVLGGVGAILLLLFVGSHLGAGGGSSPANQLSNHQLRGISSPFSQGSSLPGHIKATRVGIKQAFTTPIGHGTGSVNIASTRYSGGKRAKTVGTEFDPGNMGIAFGIVGLLAYLLLLFYAVRTNYRSAVLRRDAVGYFGIGMLMATLFQWTNGDLYAVCWLIWLFLGFLDVSLRDRLRRDATAVPTLPAGYLDDGGGWRRPGGGHRSGPPA